MKVNRWDSCCFEVQRREGRGGEPMAKARVSVAKSVTNLAELMPISQKATNVGYQIDPDHRTTLGRRAITRINMPLNVIISLG